ncbi:MAG: glycosyltransferase, partial [Candidatus Deferrimicrobiota bacterium]
MIRAMKGRELNVPGAAPLLTIAVPTYNRARTLDLCLSRIAVQIKGREDQVELIVANNCSTDGTDAVVEKHLACGVPIRYLRHERNIGPDA